MKISFVVEFDLPAGASEFAATAYVREAIAKHQVSFHNSSPFRALRTNSIQVMRAEPRTDIPYPSKAKP